ncbi:100K protein [Human adenovirus 4]|uniref:Shutoff protein n=3 Tax=Human mastadenovirus E TaxID=130308 RepID=Q2KSE5_ADE04|nr:100 kDa hexon-assembly associated protein [Human adenovirus E4]AVD49603.1 100 kDa hexon-assembly associated protein [Human mastadenovirus E]BBH49072.1 100 kDa protein [Human adenovirus 4a]ANQ44271.1 hexon assembly protein 100K [Human adenovirus E4]AVQ69152.1 100 kDa hexon-assembly associated protein [Human mastadenovirus E]
METQPSSPTLPSAPTADNKQQQNESLTAPPPSPAISDAAPDMQEMEESIEIDLGYVTPAEHEEELAVRFSTQEEIHQEQPEQEAESERDYLHLSGGEDALIKHLARQAIIVKDALLDRTEVPLSVEELSRAYELNLFSPRVPPKRQPNGTCEPNPRLNFYPVFAVPEALATYHIFFKNQRIPVSCRANRTRADALFDLGPGARIPDIASLEEVPKIFEGLGSDETRAANALQGEGGEHEHHSALVELEGDNARLAVLKRTIELTHFAYPALNLPPKVMSTVMDQVLIKRASPISKEMQDPESSEEGKPVVSDEQLARWLGPQASPQSLEERRKLIMAVVLVTAELECLRRFFADAETLRKVEENLHYIFRHGFVRQACKISNVELTNLVSYMGILHENRLGQNVLHTTLRGEARRDYIRDCVYLYLCHTWQTAMGVWQQCLEEQNLKELCKLLQKNLKALWTGFDERTTASDLANLIFPERLRLTLRNGLPDFMSQSMLQNFRSFILERSGILPATCSALPSDFVPLTFRECPPPLWSHCYLLRLANYLAYHSDVIQDVSGEGLLECHCRCNLCTPHRSLVCNPQLLSETQIIGTFELQGPGDEGSAAKGGLKLTPGLWTSAYLRKFVPQDYHPFEIRFYEDQSQPPKAELTACVITQGAILAQLQAIQKSRQEFLLKKGRGVYLDPQTGEELNPGFPQDAQRKQQEAESGAAAREGFGGKLGKQSGRGGGDGRLGQHSGRGGQPARQSGRRGGGRSSRRQTVVLGGESKQHGYHLRSGSGSRSTPQ